MADLLENIMRLSSSAIWEMSGETWLKLSWRAAAQPYDSAGESRVVNAHRGIWRVQCRSLDLIASLRSGRDITSSLYRLRERRSLPALRSISYFLSSEWAFPILPPQGFSFAKMPKRQCIALAWRLCVDEETAETTEILSTFNGVWQIRCNSQHAWEKLQNADRIIQMMPWVASRLKSAEIPPLERLEVLLGHIVPKTSAAPMSKETGGNSDNDGSTEAEAFIDDAYLCGVIARLRGRKS